MSAADEHVPALVALLDRQYIEELLIRFTLALDAGHIRRTTDVYVDGFLVEMPAVRFRLVGSPEAWPVSPIDRTQRVDLSGLAPYAQLQHVIATPTVEIDGDRAVGRANLIAMHIHSDARPDEHFDLGGVYDFEAIRTTDGWRLAEIRLAQVWTSGSGLGPDTLA
jgi:hypothetical protein